jgi:hypothetical protein
VNESATDLQSLEAENARLRAHVDDLRGLLERSIPFLQYNGMNQCGILNCPQCAFLEEVRAALKGNQ